MKLKRLPEDFQVEELTEFATADAGEFALYRLTKRGLGTPEAIEAIVRRWKLRREQVSFGGMKDRHAVTKQHVTIRRGPRRGLQQTNLELEYVGQATRPFGPADIAGNRFEIVMRALDDAELAAAEAALAEVDRAGLPNYFDDQRFGSLGASGEFVARAWIAGDFQRALWLALADANPLDRPRDADEKRRLRERWGQWPELKPTLRHPHRRDVVSFLCDRPDDFRGAFVRIPAGVRNLYVSAFQSHLWNRLLSAFIRETCGAEQIVEVPLKPGPVAFFRDLDAVTRDTLSQARLPLPSSRMRLDDDPIKPLVDRSLGEFGLALRDIRIKYPRDSFFSKGWRAATFTARGLESSVGPDELYPGRKELAVRFDLPRGSYATILIKRVTAAAGSPHHDELENAEPLELDDEAHEEATEANV